MLAATAIGAGAGELLHHEVADKVGEQAGPTIPIGGVGQIVAYSHSEAEKVEPAVTRAVQQAIGEAEGNHVHALEGAIAGRPAEDGRTHHVTSRTGQDESRLTRFG